MTPPPTDLDELALRLVRQLDRSLDGHRASGDAYVASVYGEWGIGKTWCLKSVREVYALRLQERLDAGIAAGGAQPPLVVPVWFDPWRYEHEQHLVVPLLKTIEFALRQVAAQLEAAAKAERDRKEGIDEFVERNAELGRALLRGAKTLGRVAQALLAAVKFKAAPLGIGFDIDPEAAIDHSQKTAVAAAAAEASAGSEGGDGPTLGESMYFDAQARLESLTQGADHVVPLRLVVLVDDLDRCLPEKAVQVLESVKLFLNVPGFSFVLAVDDEVVERGIAHRYRDYRLADSTGAFTADVPISGTQYLEKIVHLPLHLPRWTREKAERFLKAGYAEIYAGAAAAASAARSGDDGAPHDESRRDRDADASSIDKPARAVGSATGSTGDAQAAAALAMVLDGVPLVPRKLIRLSEGVDHLRALFTDRGLTKAWSLPHAVRVVALQQMHPTLYRHLRQRAGRYWRLFDLQRDAWNEPRYRDGENLALLKGRFEKREGPESDVANAGARQERETLREKLDLLTHVQHSGSQRGAGDPLDLFRLANGEAVPESKVLGLELQAFADLYFGGEPPPAASAPASATPAGAALPESRVADPSTAVAALLSPDAVSRREFIEAHGLAGKRLPAEAMGALLDGLDAKGDAASALVLDMRWLRDLAELTSPEQLLELYARGKVVKRWVDDLAAEERAR